MVWQLAVMFSLSVTFYQCVVVFPLVMLAALIPISIGGWGVREVSAVYLFSLYGVPEGESLQLGALFGISYFLLSLPGGLFWFVDKAPLSKEVVPKYRDN